MGLKMLTRSMVIAMTILLTVSSCFTDDEIITGQIMSYGAQPMILGKKLENPFSISNMKKAVESLRASGVITVDQQIHTTHLYVRFLPPDETSLDELLGDTTLNITDYPVDYEIIQPGDFYHDPSIPEEQITYQYATVPVGHTLPQKIPYEILDELYLPQTDLLIAASNGRTTYEEIIDAIEDEAFKISGNIEEIEDIVHDKTSARKKKWIPSGRVTVWDNRLNKYIPLEGVKVQARRWFDVKKAYTDASGNFRMKKGFRHRTNYSIKWERDDFDIRSGTFGQARLNGPKMKGEWNVQIERGGITFHYAHVFRAAMRYYYGDIDGLKRPSFRIKYSVFNKRGNQLAKNIGNWSVFGINPNILLYRYSSLDGSENDSDEMFSMTCHETAHATHMEIMRGGAVRYMQVSETIRESWAIGVEWFITQKEYKEKGIKNYAEANYKVNANYPTLHGFQFWNKTRNAKLTSLFIDLVDKNNQLGQSFGSFARGSVSDPVSGYTFAGIESGFLREVYGLESLTRELKTHKPAEISLQQIDVLMKNF